jgi:hypothetical protein
MFEIDCLLGTATRTETGSELKIASVFESVSARWIDLETGRHFGLNSVTDYQSETDWEIGKLSEKLSCSVCRID